MRTGAPAATLVALLGAGCAKDCARIGIDGPGEITCRVPGWSDRDVLVHTPAGWDGASALPLVVARHGHSGTGAGFDATTCAEGEEGDATCLDAVADAAGFVVVYPDGTGGPLGFSRSWNAGGGEEGYRCTGDPACTDGVDDLAYDDDLHTLLAELLPIDAERVYATGMSNGAAMSHRLACERPGRYAAIVAVAGANQAFGSPGCNPATRTPILQIHGTADPCWGWDGTVGELCAGEGEGDFVAVEESMAAWATLNGCSGVSVETPLPDSADDGTTTVRVSAGDCLADTELLRVEGGGHTWPGGKQYLSADRIGPVTQDFSASAEMWAFMVAHPAGRPAL